MGRQQNLSAKRLPHLEPSRFTVPVIRRKSSWLPLAAVAGPVVFDLAWLVLGPLQSGYSSVSQPVSALAVGSNGAFMRVAFILYGILVTIGVVAAVQDFQDKIGKATRWICAAMLSLSPLGALWAGVFTLDSLAAHQLGAEFAFGAPIGTFLGAGLLLRREPSWRRFGTWMLLGSPLTLVLMAGFINSVPPSDMVTGGGRYGLWQRALILEIQFWYVMLGWLAFSLHKPASALASTRHGE